MAATTGNPTPPDAAGSAAASGTPDVPLTVDQLDGTLRFRFTSNFDDGKLVQQRILDEVAANDFGEDATFALRLALEEALINAIKHGNQLDPQKFVEVDLTVSPAQAEIIIQDQGPGFSRDDIPDPTKPENLEKCSGRGILLIEAYMTKAEWTDEGRRLRMVKVNAAEPPQVP